MLEDLAQSYLTLHHSIATVVGLVGQAFMHRPWMIPIAAVLLGVVVAAIRTRHRARKREAADAVRGRTPRRGMREPKAR